MITDSYTHSLCLIRVWIVISVLMSCNYDSTNLWVDMSGVGTAFCLYIFAFFMHNYGIIFYGSICLELVLLSVCAFLFYIYMTMASLFYVWYVLSQICFLIAHSLFLHTHYYDIIVLWLGMSGVRDVFWLHISNFFTHYYDIIIYGWVCLESEMLSGYTFLISSHITMTLFYGWVCLESETFSGCTFPISSHITMTSLFYGWVCLESDMLSGCTFLISSHITMTSLFYIGYVWSQRCFLGAHFQFLHT